MLKVNAGKSKIMRISVSGERKPLGVRLGSEELEELTGFKHMEYFVLRVVLFTQVWEGTESNGRVDWLMEKEE